MRVRVTRTLVYEGDSRWVELVLESSLLKPGVDYNAGLGVIRMTNQVQEVVDDAG